MKSKERGWRLEFAFACVWAAAQVYAVLDWGALIVAAALMPSFLLLPTSRRIWRTLLLLPLLLPAGLILLWGLFFALCSLVVLPAPAFRVLLGLAAFYGGARLFIGARGRRGWLAAAAAATLFGLFLSPPGWSGLRAGYQKKYGAVPGWRYRVSGPESRGLRPRFYVPGARGKLSPVAACPSGTRPVKIGGEGWLCR